MIRFIIGAVILAAIAGLRAVAGLSTISDENIVFQDIYGKNTSPPMMNFSDCVCRVTESPVASSGGPWQNLGPSCIGEPRFPMRYILTQNHRYLPMTEFGDLPISNQQLYELLKPLHATGSMCCAARITPQLFKAHWMMAWPIKYLTTVECRSENNTVQSAEVEFAGDNFACMTNLGQDEHRRVNAGCPIPETKNGDAFWCSPASTGWPDWADYRLKESVN